MSQGTRWLLKAEKWVSWAKIKSLQKEHSHAETLILARETHFGFLNSRTVR